MQAHSRQAGRSIVSLHSLPAIPSFLISSLAGPSLRSVAAGSHFFSLSSFPRPSFRPPVLDGARIGTRDDACYTISWLRLAPSSHPFL